MASARDQNRSYANQMCCPDAKLFRAEFLSAARKRMKSVNFRSGSMFAELRRPVHALISGPIVCDSVIGSSGALAPTETEGLLAPVPVPKEVVLPTTRVHSAVEVGLGISSDGPKPTIDGGNAVTVHTSTVTNRPRTPFTKEQHFKESAIASDLVYRIQGIPINYQRDCIKELLRSKFELDPSMEIDVRSLAASQDQTARTAVVSFVNATSATSFEENDWSFRWYLENNKATHIKIDTHFIGLTMLYTPDDAKHEIE
jgi:hypothetical protein